MATDLLNTIREEIDQRLDELRPLLAEYERLLGVAGALVARGSEEGEATAQKGRPATRARGKARVGASRRGPAAEAIELATAGSTKVELDGKLAADSRTRLRAGEGQAVTTPHRSAVRPKPERAVRGAAREAILGALEHGSHTVGELAVVTAMSGPNINGNLRRLALEGVVVKTEREGKTAWSLVDSAV